MKCPHWVEAAAIGFVVVPSESASRSDFQQGRPAYPRIASRRWVCFSSCSGIPSRPAKADRSCATENCKVSVWHL